MYSEKVLKYFKNPKNIGEIKDANGIGKVGNVVCGDIMHLYIKVKDGIITDAKFKTFGCVSAIASSSAATELVIGKSIDEALKVSKDDIIDSLDGLPPQKIHCSVLGIEALHEAIYDYLSKNKLEIPEWLEKKHQRIEKEKQIIEEKYAEYNKDQGK